MSLNEYQELSKRTTTGHHDTAMVNFALGVTGEAGEVADLVKKYMFHGHKLDKDAVAKELGDVLWYVSQLAVCIDVDLEEIAQRNLDKLKLRYPNGFSEQDSINRVEGNQ
ncbi:MazG family protein [Listeria weihenstephanensis FSL R9-0317]|uniref:Nucleotide pyrophosphohydrolase n=1 Tax=Listeria weihenstephanensis TaxID=1006155 RepID=A0A1S7FT04_9LIST|nr:nucleoside triphosphate pyrophosphohydrolase family protein [Listeria weihenstephanensis]AQY50499.1 nucleotide pyrophosphohydrolase [Listeria phage LWP01] [Listeria weihenstephanensis]AQY52643.1 nucleotide pyrophosphohydrolase [Listeria phage LWP01]EUJ41515.1 MazG family protein [Listeria weihenstephanensis FSL R9-0317]